MAIDRNNPNCARFIETYSSRSVLLVQVDQDRGLLTKATKKPNQEKKKTLP